MQTHFDSIGLSSTPDTTNLTAVGVLVGTGAPTFAAPKGTLYIRTDGSSVSTRLYINTNGSTTWTSITTGA